MATPAVVENLPEPRGRSNELRGFNLPTHRAIRALPIQWTTTSLRANGDTTLHRAT